MAIIKCKMCGGDIELAADKTYGMCEFCGSTMTFPKVDDDQRAAAFNRGNHFRRIGEFDKALAVYERIVREDDTDAEAHWCCALCRFGIEYVEDPATYEYLPTCHRASFDSFLEDVDYKSALKYSDGITRRQYQKDGAKIAEVQRGILATSQTTEPYDVFICYKESDANGNRTRDSLMAQDIYYQLTEQGRKVFFARITLEDVAGTQYEPYIFAALNSAKVMIVVGTKAEYLNAVWVKNEWSRFLAMMKKDRHKLLLPCYRDMDPYDMPEALSVLQSYDMGKIGFIQDLTRGIAKVLDAEKKPELVKETVVVQQSSALATNTAPLLKRAFMFLEDGEWNRADEFCEQVLNIDPECAQAYLGKLMAELRITNQENLKNQAKPFDWSNNYQKVLRFGDDKLKAELAGYIEHINTRIENTRLANIYNRAKDTMSVATESAYIEAAHLFESISEYEDAATLAQICYERAEVARKDAILAQGKARMREQVVVSYENAIKLFESIPGWKDADKQIVICQNKIEEIKAKAEADRLERERKAEAERLERERKEEADRLEQERIAKRNKKIAIITTPIVCAIIAIVIIFTTVIPNGKYNDAVALMNAGQYDEAIAAFEAMDGYKDSNDQILECKYREGYSLMDAGEFVEAINILEPLGNYKDINDQILECKYREGCSLMDAGEFVEAINILEPLGNYKDSMDKVFECAYQEACSLMDEGELVIPINAFELLGDYKDSADKYLECKYQVACSLMDAGKYTEAMFAFGAIGDYSDAKEQAEGLWSKVALRETIAADSCNTVGLKTDGSVVAVGDNMHGQCNVGWKDIVAISAGGAHTVGLKADGTVVAAGLKEDGQCDVSGWKDIVAISAGRSHTVGLKADGSVVAVGFNNDGQCDVSSWKDIVAISAGDDYTVGLKADGSVVAAGNNNYRRCDVSGWKDIVAISAGSNHTVGLKANGSVVATGYNGDDRCDVGSWKDMIAISAGGAHTVGLKADGSVVAAGKNNEGQCDVSGWTDIKIPEK